ADPCATTTRPLAASTDWRTIRSAACIGILPTIMVSPRSACSARATAAGRRQLRVCADADMVDSHHVDERPDVLGILGWRIGEMRPDGDAAPGGGDVVSHLFTDEPWPHHASHVRVLSHLRVEPRMRDDH